jgi:two-component system, NtrC family, sensor kinase
MPPRELTVRVLRIAIAAAVIVPCLLFAYASWVSYRSANTLADERIVRSLDVQQEQAVKAFQLIDNALNDAADLVAGLSDDQIRAEESQLHFEFGKLVRSAPVVQSIWIYDPTGVPLVTSWVEQPPLHSYADRDFFQAHLRPGTGMYYGKVYASEFDAQAFFTISRRLEMDGAFAGVLEVSVLPSNFVRFFRHWPIHRDFNTPCCEMTLLFSPGIQMVNLAPPMCLVRIPPSDAQRRGLPTAGSTRRLLPLTG